MQSSKQFGISSNRSAIFAKWILFCCVDEKNSKILHKFRFVNEVHLNESNKDLLVNFLEYWQSEGDEVKHFRWVTDFAVNLDDAYQIMRGGRARWKVENETFNTLKNQGYHLERNYRIGSKNLNTNFGEQVKIDFLSEVFYVESPCG